MPPRRAPPPPPPAHHQQPLYSQHQYSQQQQQQPYNPVPQSPSYTPPPTASSPTAAYPPSHAQQASLGGMSLQMSPLSGGGREVPSTSTVGRGGGGGGGGGYAGRPEMGEGRESTTQGVLSGTIGGGFGPYAYQPPPTQRDSIYSLPQTPYSTYPRHSFAPSESGLSVLSSDQKPVPPPPQGGTATVPTPMYLWDARDPDLDDALHNPDPIADKRLDRHWTIASARGWINLTTIFVLIFALLTLFVGYPVIWFELQPRLVVSGFNLGGINSTGQVPDIPGVWALIDPSTPQAALSRTGYDGEEYTLVFSDEFETDGRSFYPGDDPYWEAVNLHYWATVDYEWYDPSAITTKDGKLQITMTEELIHDLNWKSGMLQSWNKFCFTTGYIEVSISLPGQGDVPGFWPGVWMMGNLGRAGYGATTEGLWPYSYDSCDIGTYPNQTTKLGQPAITFTDGDPYNNNQLSYLPGQRLSACSCPGSDHPGPNVGTGRGAPEIDVLEAQVNVWDNQGSVSQSFQVAPFNDFYEFDNTTTTIYNAAETVYNGYKGGVYQQSVSAVTLVSNANYDDNAYGIFGVEYWADPGNRAEGFMTWVADAEQTWYMPAAAIGPDPITTVSERLVSEEPMSINLNFGMSPGFQGQDFTRLQFPATMYVDYVRVYQRSSVANDPNYRSCDPPSYPTASYINAHANAYNNPNLTTWDMAGYTFPRNSQYDGC